MKTAVIFLLGIAFFGLVACNTAKPLTQEEIEGKNYQEVFGMLDVSEIEEKPDQLPMYPKGNVGVVNDIQSNVIYPASAKEAGAEGNVLVSFIVTKKGTVKDIELIKGVNPDLDKAALKVMKTLQPFMPAVIDGEKVDIKLKSLITFRLPAEPTGTSKQ